MTEATTRHESTRHVPGTPCWTSLLACRPDRSQEFYHGLFGWEFREGAQHPGPYLRAVSNGCEVAGIGEMGPGRQRNPAWLPYLATDDADRTAALIHECGGTVAVGPLDAEEEGRMAIAADPSGAAFGIWQAGRHIGLPSEAAGSPGTPVWYELVTHGTQFARSFYPSVFGYDTAGGDAVPDSDYLTLELNGNRVAGVHGVGHDLLRDRGPHWRTYFAVEDTDRAVADVVRLGGVVIDPPRDSPFGRVAGVADPEGARFKIIALREG